jgi:hypothetical protein
MSVWWGRESTSGDLVTLTRTGGEPILMAGDRTSLAAQVRARVPAFAPAWRRRTDDAGEALVRLFGEQLESLLQRLGRWPEKALVELLVTAGISQRPATPATSTLRFTVSASAARSVLVPQGFQVGASPPGGGPLITFETDRDLLATPADLAAAFVESQGNFTSMPLDAPLVPFRDNGDGLWLGLDGDFDIGPELSLGFDVAGPAGTPPPVGEGGVIVLPVAPAPLLGWQILDGANLQPLQLLSDDTEGLARSGAMVVRLPRTWAAGAPFNGAPLLRWLRLGVAGGSYATPPSLTAVYLNAVAATAAITVLDEVLEPLPDGRSYQLSQTPVLAGTLILSVDDVTWSEVDDLSAFGPDDHVYTVDGALGIVYTGDGLHGAAVPSGFRNVVALRYRWGGGASGAVPAGAISAPISAVPSVSGAVNSRAADGGDDAEPFDDAVFRGPQEIRARGRAVTLADYELMAPATPETDVRRAHALGGHPAYPEASLTGVVGVIVVPADRGEGPPTPGSGTLEKVARYLSAHVAPAGVEVVAAAPEYHRVRIEARLILAPDAPVGATVEAVLAALDRWLHPLTGGDDGHGWPFGGPLRRADAMRQIVAVPGVLAAPQLDLVVDGVLAPDCSDVPIPAHALLWPDPHQVLPQEDAP